jgi:hypothetical protein
LAYCVSEDGKGKGRAKKLRDRFSGSDFHQVDEFSQVVEFYGLSGFDLLGFKMSRKNGDGKYEIVR